MSQNKDIFYNIKYIAYCRSQLPPIKEDITFEYFVKFAKFKLCTAYKIPFKSAIWDDYSDEEILVEYFAHKFEKHEEFKEEFEKTLGIDAATETYDDFLEFANKMSEKVKKELESEFEEEIDFEPSIGEG